MKNYSASVVERARRYVAKCPVAVSGQGGHDAAYRVAAVLWNGFGLSDGDTMLLLREWNRGCQPPWSEGELVHKIQSVAAKEHREPRGHMVKRGVRNAECGIQQTGRPGAQNAERGTDNTSPYPLPSAERAAKAVFCPMVLKRVAAKAGAVGDVFAFVQGTSPVPVGPLDSAAVLRWLYPKGTGEKVLIFSKMKSQGQMVWEADKGDRILNRQLPAGAEGVWFLPQPVDGEFYRNPRLGGKRSRRSEEAVRAWRYAVLESDEADADEWLRCLIQMPLRIASICESGGRSIHALVRIDAASKADWDAKIGAIKPVLVTLGADAGALSAVRLTRLPQAKRGERVQRLLYLNPVPDGRPIYSGASKGKEAK